MDDAPDSRPDGGSGERHISRRSLVARAGAMLAGISVAGVGLGRQTASAAPNDPVVASGLKTTAGAVNVTSAAPRVGQVLTANGPSTAAWQSPADPAATSGSLRTVHPRGGDAVLIDPNRANGFTVVLPPSALGGVASTTILPVAGAPTTGRLWNRLLQFRQPTTGPTVDPRLTPEVEGSQPSWGSGGVGSVDVVGIVSSDGKHWMITGSASVSTTVAKSILSVVGGAPAASVDPLTLPDPILVWSAADMLAGTPDRAEFTPGRRVGQDFSGSGNELIVNAGERMTFRRGPLPGAAAVPRPLAGFPYLHSSSAKAGMGCSFVGGAIPDWTVLVSFLPADFSGSRAFDGQYVFQTRAAGKVPSVLLAIKGQKTAATWDGTSYNDLNWPADTFGTTAGRAIPTVVGWSVKTGTTLAEPLVIAGARRTALCSPAATDRTTTAPASIAGIDLASSYGYCGLAVYAAALTAEQVRQAALRLGFVGFGETS
ncbi:MAG: hypothetical protein FWC87_05220 [Acidimicrobiaceae bacterium]|nr:hypothetical protein [Acidimicrobiaceae bacterium]